MAKQFTFGKNERLKSRKQIELLFSEGNSFVVTPLRIYYLLASPATDQSSSKIVQPFAIQFAVGVSSKNFKRAVDRNRVKRLIREAYRLQKKELQEKLKEKNLSMKVFFIFTGKELAEYKFVYSKVGVALQKLLKEIVQPAKK